MIVMVDYNSIYQNIAANARNLLTNYANNGTMTVDEANAILQQFHQYSLPNLASRVYNVASTSGGQINNAQLHDAIIREIYTLLQNLRQQRMGYNSGMMGYPQQAPLVQMGTPSPQFMMGHQQPIMSSAPAQYNPSISTMADIYGYTNTPNKGIPSNQQTPPPVIQPRPELRGQVSGRIEYGNPANEVYREINATKLNEVNTTSKIINTMKLNENSHVDTSTIAVNITNNIEAMKIVESMDDTESDFKIHNICKLSSDTMIADNVVMTLKPPFTNHKDPRSTALKIIKDIPIFSSNQYYAHIVKYYTMHEILKPFHSIREKLNELLKFKELEPSAMKWNSFISILESENAFSDLRKRFNRYLMNVTKCMFNYSTPDGRSNTLIAEDVSDIPNILNEDGEYSKFVGNDRLLHEAYTKFKHVYDYLIPTKFYLDPTNAYDQTILVNRPDSGIIYNGRLLRYSEDIYVDVIEGDGDNKVTYSTYSKDIISKISNTTIIMQKHIVLLTNIPFAQSTLMDIVHNPKHRAIIPKPQNTLECILEKVHSPICIDDNSGINYVAGRNLDTHLTIFID